MTGDTRKAFHGEPGNHFCHYNMEMEVRPGVKIG